LGLPITFLVGLIVVFATRDYFAPAPGSGNLGTLAGHAWLVPVPFLLVVAALRVLRMRLVDGRRRGLHPRWLLNASASASPIAVYVVSGPGGWFDLAWRWSGDSHLLGFCLLAVPLVLVEVPRLILATLAHLWAEIDEEAGAQTALRHSLPGLGDVRALVRLRLGWPLLLTMPWALLGAGLDVLQLHRASYTFVLGTSPGATLGTLGFLTLGAMLLPFWFRLAFGARTTLPEPTGTLLRRTAATLGFRPSRVLMLPTGNRALNAMMVGPLPVGRCLLVTDGLLRSLDDDLLAGVVAHEVGHAKMGHPGLLMILAVVVPLLLVTPLGIVDLEQVGVLWQAAAGLLVIVFTWSVVRSLAQRFELEADIVSVQALGSGPCSRALMAVAHMAVPVAHSLLRRIFTLHPEEPTRCETMRRYELEPTFRARFDALLGAAAIAAAAAWTIEWPYERVFWRLGSGDVVAAKRLAVELDNDIPERWRESWTRLHEDLEAASAIAPDASDWSVARSLFAEQGWRHGVETLLRAGPAAARPWFALAAEAGGGDRVLRQAVYEFCRAAREGDVERKDEIRAVLQRRGVPAELEPVFREPTSR